MIESYGCAVCYWNEKKIGYRMYYDVAKVSDIPYPAIVDVKEAERLGGNLIFVGESKETPMKLVVSFPTLKGLEKFKEGKSINMWAISVVLPYNRNNIRVEFGDSFDKLEEELIRYRDRVAIPYGMKGAFEDDILRFLEEPKKMGASIIFTSTLPQKLQIVFGFQELKTLIEFSKKIE